MQNQPASHILNPSIWEGIRIEEVTLPPGMLMQPRVDCHRLAVNLGPAHNVEIKRPNGWEKKHYATGGFSLVPYGEGNIIRWFIPINFMLITVDPCSFQQLLQWEQIPLAEQRGVADPTVLQLIREIKREVLLTESPGKLFWQSLTLCLSTHLATKYLCTGKELFAPKGKLSSVQLKQVIEFCNASLKDDISLDDLAAQANLSTFHFARLFKKTLGITPHQFVLQLRIEWAKRFLKQNHLSHTHIAYELGFTDLAHFANTFKKVTGLTPSQFPRA